MHTLLVKEQGIYLSLAACITTILKLQTEQKTIVECIIPHQKFILIHIKLFKTSIFKKL